jgi:hypothetical protein
MRAESLLTSTTTLLMFAGHYLVTKIDQAARWLSYRLSTTNISNLSPIGVFNHIALHTAPMKMTCDYELIVRHLR